MMKVLLPLFMCLSFWANAQIPNNGFENWSNFGSYQDPTFWGSTNSYASGPFYAVTKSTDHFPINVGSYSVRIENNIALSPNFSGRGSLFTGPPPPGPDFSVTGHPSSLTGYYKFNSQNNDTMLIQVQLYSNGTSVAFGTFTSNATISSWTTFSLNLSSYAITDSASLILAAYNANGFNYIPHGNSVLYIDNLNFDSFITGINSNALTETKCLSYPNPASDRIYFNNGTENYKKRLFDLFGNLIVDDMTEGCSLSHLTNGVYFIEFTDNSTTIRGKLIIEH